MDALKQVSYDPATKNMEICFSKDLWVNRVKANGMVGPDKS